MHRVRLLVHSAGPTAVELGFLTSDKHTGVRTELVSSDLRQEPGPGWWFSRLADKLFYRAHRAVFLRLFSTSCSMTHTPPPPATSSPQWVGACCVLVSWWLSSCPMTPVCLWPAPWAQPASSYSLAQPIPRPVSLLGSWCPRQTGWPCLRFPSAGHPPGAAHLPFLACGFKLPGNHLESSSGQPLSALLV